MQISTNQFTYRNGTFTAEASTLGSSFIDLFGPVLDNPKIKGFELVSARTGQVVKVLLLGPRWNNEGDLTHWDFMPYQCDAFNDLIIFND